MISVPHFMNYWTFASFITAKNPLYFENDLITSFSLNRAASKYMVLVTGTYTPFYFLNISFVLSIKTNLDVSMYLKSSEINLKPSVVLSPIVIILIPLFPLRYVGFFSLVLLIQFNQFFLLAVF